MATKTKHSQEQAPAAPALITLVKHHMELHNAYGVGADCVNRIGTMIQAASEVVKDEIPDGHHTRLVLNFLNKCVYISDELAGFLESERDAQLEHAVQQEGK